MTKNILVVEDEFITALDLQNSLQTMGYHVVATCSSGEEAIRLVQIHSPDLVLMDIVLQGKMNGIETAEYIAQNNHIPVVYLTAYNDNSTFNQAKLSVPYGYLTKPVDKQVLNIVVDLALYKYQIEQALALEKERIRATFLESFSHELRIPLNEIMTAVDNIEKENWMTNSDGKRALTTISNNTHYLFQVLTKIAALTEIEKGQVQFNATAIDLQALVNNVKNEFESALAEKKLKLIVNVDTALSLKNDIKKLETILSCYLSNAIKFSSEGSQIEINIQAEDKDHFKVEVKDQGVGIEAKDIPRIFHPFQKLSATTSGAGLGLALVRSLVEIQNGWVGVFSHPKQGSTFYAILPNQAELKPITQIV